MQIHASKTRNRFFGQTNHKEHSHAAMHSSISIDNNGWLMSLDNWQNKIKIWTRQCKSLPMLSRLSLTNLRLYASHYNNIYRKSFLRGTLSGWGPLGNCPFYPLINPAQTPATSENSDSWFCSNCLKFRSLKSKFDLWITNRYFKPWDCINPEIIRHYCSCFWLDISLGVHLQDDVLGRLVQYFE